MSSVVWSVLEECPFHMLLQHAKCVQDAMISLKILFDSSRNNELVKARGALEQVAMQEQKADQIKRNIRKLLNERNKLATEMGTADTSAKEMAGMQYEDSTLPLTVAEKTLGFQKDQYSVLGDILSQVYGASEKDVANLIDSAKYGKERVAKAVIISAVTPITAVASLHLSPPNNRPV